MTGQSDGFNSRLTARTDVFFFSEEYFQIARRCSHEGWFDTQQHQPSCHASRRRRDEKTGQKLEAVSQDRPGQAYDSIHIAAVTSALAVSRRNWAEE